MAILRGSRLHKHILRVLLAEHHRTHGRMAMGHLELVNWKREDGSSSVARRVAGRSLSILRLQGSKKPRKSV